MKAMVRYLYRDKAQDIRRDRERALTGSGATQKQVGTGTIAAGAVIAAVGAITSHTMVAVGGVAVAAVGAVLLAADGGSRK